MHISEIFLFNEKFSFETIKFRLNIFINFQGTYNFLFKNNNKNKEKENQENDQHSSIMHKACLEGLNEQQITQLVNSHLNYQEDLEKEFKIKFTEHEENYQ